MAFMLTDNRILDDNGRPLSGGKVYVYEAGTTTPIDSFPTAAAANAGTPVNSNPVILNAAGIARIYGKDDVVYKVVIKDRNDTTIETIDNISLNGGESAAAAASAALSASASASSAAASASASESSAEAASESAIAAQASANLATPTVVNFTGDGSTTDFELPYAVEKNSTNIFVGGEYQRKGAYTLLADGTTLRFLVAPANGVNIEVNLAATSAMVSGDTTQVNYNNGASGAVTRSVRDKLREIVSVKDFGAVGDGVTDDTAAIKAALETGRRVFFPRGRYRITEGIELSGVDVDVTCDDGVIIDASDLPAGQSLREQIAISAEGSVADSSPVTVDVEPFADVRTASAYSSVTVADGSKFAPGDLVLLRSDQRFDDAWGSDSNKRGELLEVREVNGNVVSFVDNIEFAYLAASGAVLEKLAPIRFRWVGGKVLGGGVGSAHSGICVRMARNAYIEVEVEDTEDVGVGLALTYKARAVVTASNCTSPSLLGNTGYGLLVSDGSRYVEADVEALNCRHSVAGGGLYPVMDVKIRGNAVDCGIGTSAWDCHEPCFHWDFDVSCVGGRGGAVIRGSDIRIKIRNQNTYGPGLRVRTFGAVTKQRNIHIEYQGENTNSTSVQIDGEDSPIENVTFGVIDIRNTRGDGVVVNGSVTGVSGETLRVDTTYLNSGESSTGGSAFRARGEAYNPGDRVKNVSIGRLVARNLLQRAVNLSFCDGFHVGYIDATAGSAATSGPVYAEDCTDLDFPAGIVNVGSIGSGAFRTDRVNRMRVGAKIVGDAGVNTQDGWRGVDTTNAVMQGCPQVLVGRHAAYFSGTSENLVVTGNNFTDVVNATKVNAGAAVNVVEANNLS